MKLNIFILSVIFVLSVSYSFAQTSPVVPRNPISMPTPGDIKLLPDYVHKILQGIDSDVGKIYKKNGLEIRYDIGDMAGDYTKGFPTNRKSELVWSKTQKVNNLHLTIVYLKNGAICATFMEQSANFWTDIKNDEQLSDFLLMIMTYGSNNGKEPNQKSK